MYSTVVSASIDGMSSRKVTVEADVSEGLPTFSLVGFLSSETREASERVRSALRNSGVRLGAEHVTVNLAPASFHKDGSLFDLAIAVALLGAYGFFSSGASDGIMFLGELSLNGEIVPVNGVLEIVSHARQYGCDTVIVPLRNLMEGSVIGDVTVLGARDLNQVVHFLMERSEGESWPLRDSSYEPPLVPPRKLETMHIDIEKLRERQKGKVRLDFSQIRGQGLMRRASEIAVSGFHNLLMIGPPGSGKTMTAARIPTILPQPTLDEALEITKIYSIAGMLPDDMGLITTRPFRAPHHTITSAALCGGGRPPRPGEVSLSHRGVLYLDELTEFDRSVLETLRQPLEDGNIRICRVTGSYMYPANFMLIASMNPCRCGYFPDRSKCTCTNREVRRYLSKISMPLLDRIDMCVEARKVKYDELASVSIEESSTDIRRKVTDAISIQAERYRGTVYHFNSDLSAEGVRQYCILDNEGQSMMRMIYESMGLTARSYNRILKVARTIADLSKSENIMPDHLVEAVSFRAIDRKYWDSVLRAS